MAALNKNMFLVGTNGAVWVNGQLLSNIKKIELKLTGSFEDVSVIDNYGTFAVFTGYSGDGTVTLQKVDSYVVNLLSDAYKTGVMPDITIISRLTNKATGKTERIAVKDVSFTEYFLANYESKGLIEEAIPLKFSGFEVLDTI